MKRSFSLLTAAAGLLLPLLLLVFFFSALTRLDAGQGEENRARLEDALRRAAVACYAAEGVYPPDLAYLEEHYGVQIDREQYGVFYEVFAQNLMPEITVVELES